VRGDFSGGNFQIPPAPFYKGGSKGFLDTL
jgi:hypothetical protein